MRLYWYWPYLRPEHLPLVDAMAERVDELVVHVVAGRIDPSDFERGRARIDASLPDVETHPERSLAWMRSRLVTYRDRVRHRHARASQFDVAHIVFVNRFTDWWSLERLGKASALVTSVHDVMPHHSRLPEFAERAVLRRLYRRGGEIVVHHPSIGRRLSSEFAIEPERIHDVPHWVLPADAEQRDRPGIPPTVLCFGALRRNKGIDVLTAAIERSPDLDAHFVFAGRGVPEIESALRRAAERDARIALEIGYVSESRKDELYRGADLVVLPYTSFASQSGVLHDAYAHGRPVVVSDVGALGDTVRADGTGRVVAPGDPAALGAAVTGLLADGSEWRNAALASESVRTEQNPARTAERLLEVYEHALRR